MYLYATPRTAQRSTGKIKRFTPTLSTDEIKKHTAHIYAWSGLQMLTAANGSQAIRGAATQSTWVFKAPVLRPTCGKWIKYTEPWRLEEPKSAELSAHDG